VKRQKRKYNVKWEEKNVKSGSKFLISKMLHAANKWVLHFQSPSHYEDAMSYHDRDMLRCYILCAPLKVVDCYMTVK
jgi:hypothetical protein